MKYLFLSFLILMVGRADASNWYVDNAASSSGNGQSWSEAFNSFSAIPWSSINPGDTLFISGGSSGKTYTSDLVVGKSGTASARITIRVGQDSGHAGPVVFDGASARLRCEFCSDFI